MTTKIITPAPPTAPHIPFQLQPPTDSRASTMTASTYTLTPESDLQLAFDPALIPQEIKDQLPQEITVRPLASDDYNRGHLRVLADLTKAPDTGLQAWQKQFALQQSISNTYYPIVFLDKHTDQIVACGTVFVELKFLRNNGIVGHIEDIVVHKDGQGKGLGKRIIEVLTAVAKARGCYKVILDCSPHNVAFYEKCGYHNAGTEMAIYFI
ncbi:acyl-CoA N-acyltransferase [Testicularia cyperi]|uniref:Glucosamine 6-phosphate N-acetyltransferase n=1 Tax=Testicularia cyperi TaxID=1882483 RepID=A0A317XNH4_9BASI|nr:acyl-CoA N-acyltransferase [Testicularia cyperi]